VSRETREPARATEREPAREPRNSYRNDNADDRARPLREHPDVPMERYRIHVGHADGVTPREIVGAIANEADMEGKYIGHIRIYDDYTTVDLPDGMPRDVFEILKKTRVCNKPLKIERANEKGIRPSTGAEFVAPLDNDEPKEKKFNKEKIARTSDFVKPAEKSFTRVSVDKTAAEPDAKARKPAAKLRDKPRSSKDAAPAKAPARVKPKVKVGRVDKDKGKRRTATPKEAEE
jgi:ATP-dependent RNA helicase DeaD